VLAAIGVYQVDGWNPVAVLAPALAAAVLAGVFAELLVRGLLFRVVEQAQGTWVALASSAVVFGALHLFNPGATVVTAAAIALQAGVLLGLAYVVTRRLWLPIGLHVAWNAIQGGVFGSPASGIPTEGLLRSQLTGPALLSGGGFGVEGSVVTVLACLAASGLLMRVARHRAVQRS
jgi:membrane protease YdiL (CAAX protease family)